MDMYAKALTSHNIFRSMHQVRPLVWDNNLAVSMQLWIDGCVWGHDLANKVYGENLYAVYGQSMQSHDEVMHNAVLAWYNEVSMYNFAYQGFSEQTGHFTAMIWKNTNAMGCYVKSCSQQGFVYAGCRYLPPGNVMGQFEQNVFPKAVPKRRILKI